MEDGGQVDGFPSTHAHKVNYEERDDTPAGTSHELHTYSTETAVSPSFAVNRQVASTNATIARIKSWSVEVTITGASPQQPPRGLKPYTAYAVQVDIWLAEEQRTVAYSLSKRYSRFLDLHKQLSREYPGTRLPSFPQRIGKSSADPEVITERIESLHNYMSALMVDDDLSTSEALFSFLELNAAAQLLSAHQV